MDPVSLKSDLNPVRANPPAGKPQSKEQKKLWNACKDFESVMMGQVLKQMRQTVQISDPLNNSQASKMYRDMLDDEMSKSMSKGGGFGLAEQMYNQLAATVK